MKDIADAVAALKLATKEESDARAAVEEAQKNLAAANDLLSNAITRTTDARRRLDRVVERALASE